MHADYIADSLSSVVSHPVTVQVINQGPGIWGSVAAGLITAGAAIAAVMLTHRFTLLREKQASEENRRREEHYIATELVFMLERFAEECARVAMDDGELIPPAPGKQCERQHTVEEPKINLDGITGDWRVLDPLLMYRIRELPVLQIEADRKISYANESDSPPDYSEYFHERQYQYARLGLKALIQAKHLRKSSRLPDTRVTKWSAQSLLWSVWRVQRHRISKEAIENRDFSDTQFEDMDL